VAQFDITSALSYDGDSIGATQNYDEPTSFGVISWDQSDIESFMTVLGIYVTFDTENEKVYLNMVAQGRPASMFDYPSAFSVTSLTFTPAGGEGPPEDEVTLAGADAKVTYLPYADNFGSTDPLDARMVWTWEVNDLPLIFSEGEDITFTLEAVDAARTSFNCECDDE